MNSGGDNNTANGVQTLQFNTTGTGNTAVGYEARYNGLVTSGQSQTYKLNTSRAKADKVIANGVTNDSGAQFNFVAVANKTLTAGKVFAVISNTSANPIAGTFANLPEGSTFTVGHNTFQASYEGDDGNDLTLTVLPSYESAWLSKGFIDMIAAMKSPIVSCAMIFAFLLSALDAIYADSATWNLHPTSGDWNTAINWTPATVPNGPGSSATFDVSNTTSVGISADINIGSIVFNLGASAYTITAGSADSDTSLTISGPGVVNNSGVMQNFILAGGPASANTMFFTGAAAAGVMTVYTCAAGAGSGNTYLKFMNSSSADHATVITDGPTGQGLFLAGWVFFEKNATASDATIINNPGVFAGGKTFFYDRATAANATVICNGATASTNRGGSVEMNQNATGGDATFIVNGSDSALQGGGNLDFINSSTGGDATIIVNGGLKDGGHLVLSTVDTDSRARCEIFGNGELDLELVDGQIGSLEGDGLVFLGPLNLTVGGNSLETTFSGVIADGGPIGGVGGSLTIANDGSLELTNANTYTGLTAVSGGTLIASNATGSATGTGPVTVYAGTLSGNGIIGGAVTLGDGAGRSVLLAPSYKTTKYVTLTIQGYLTFNPHAIYNYTFRAKRSRAKTDKVVANGVTINSNASFNLSGQTQGALTQGLVLTVIDNTALTPIAGTFSNLPDGGIVNVNGNNLQASYEGGDGNDLTLTVVP